MEREKRIMEKVLSELRRRDIEDFVKREVVKSSEKSEKTRNEGNVLYRQKLHILKNRHERIWQMYTLSIAQAPNESEQQALAYANRSVLLFHLAKFQDCLVDVNRAINITKSNALKAKWLCRKVKCLHALGDPASKEALREAKICLKLLHYKDKDRKKLQELFEETEKSLSERSLKPSEDLIDPIARDIKKEIHDYSDVTVKYDPKYGKHLVATRDIAPGEVIFVEEPYYISIANSEKPNPYCCHCHVLCLTTIPCDTCTLAYYCSEQCKKEAWIQHHNTECFCMNHLDVPASFVQSVIHTIVVECQKCGSIANFKSYLESLDQKEENLIVDGKLCTSKFELVYLIDNELHLDSLKEYLEVTLDILISLLVYTSFFGKKFKIYEWINFVKNQDVLFIGSLIFKLVNWHSHVVTLSKLKVSLDLPDTDDAHKGVCIPSVYSLINNNCDSNVNKFVTKDNHMVVYALKPVKKGEQLFSAYTSSFRTLLKPLRQDELKDALGGICDCRACKENWLPLHEIVCNTIKMWPFGYEKFLFKTPLELELFNKHKSLILNNAYLDHNFKYTEEMVSELSQSIEIALKEFTHPSKIASTLIVSLNMLMIQLYGRSYDFPSKCIN